MASTPRRGYPEKSGLIEAEFAKLRSDLDAQRAVRDAIRFLTKGKTQVRRQER